MQDLAFVHRFLPPSEQSSRVLLLLHGTGGDESDLIPLGRELDPAAGLLSPRGKVLENGMPRFFRRIAEGVFDEEDVIRRANELADFILNAAAQYGFNAEQMIAVGYSNGANIAAAIMLLRPQVIRTAVLLRAMMPLANATVPDLSNTRVLLSAGETDPIVPAANVSSLATLLKRGGAEVQLTIQRASHGLISDDLATAREWLGT